MELIGLQGVDFAYPGRPPVLEGLDFSLAQGQRVGILGPIGAGKSTLFSVAMGLLRPDAGQVRGLGQPCRTEADFAALRRRVGYLFQDPDDQLFCPTVLEDVSFGPRNLGQGRDQAVTAARAALASLGLEGFEPRVTYHLSGGEKRLVSLAGVLAMNPAALLLDEPSTGLDPESTDRLRRALVESELGWAMVSHDHGFLRATCQSLYRLERGRLASL